MSIKKHSKTEISARTQALKENSSKTSSSLPFGMARGVGFEPVCMYAVLNGAKPFWVLVRPSPS